MMKPTVQSLALTGRLRRPTNTQVYLWVFNEWGGLKKNVIENSLKKTKNANGRDGNEDNIIFEDHDFDPKRCSGCSVQLNNSMAFMTIKLVMFDSKDTVIIKLKNDRVRKHHQVQEEW